MLDAYDVQVIFSVHEDRFAHWAVPQFLGPLFTQAIHSCWTGLTVQQDTDSPMSFKMVPLVWNGLNGWTLKKIKPEKVLVFKSFFIEQMVGGLFLPESFIRNPTGKEKQETAETPPKKILTSGHFLDFRGLWKSWSLLARTLNGF